MSPTDFQFSFRSYYHTVGIDINISPVLFKYAVAFRTNLYQVPQLCVNEHALVLTPLFHVFVKIKVIVLPICSYSVSAKGIAAGIPLNFEAVHAEQGVGLDLFHLGKKVEDFGIRNDGIIFEDVAKRHFFGRIDSGEAQVAILDFDVELQFLLILLRDLVVRVTAISHQYILIILNSQFKIISILSTINTTFAY